MVVHGWVGDEIFVRFFLLLIQFAKRDCLKVIVTTGLDDKFRFIKGLGVDATFNYKTTKMSEGLAKGFN